MKTQPALLLCTLLVVGCTGASESKTIDPTQTAAARGSLKADELSGSCKDSCGAASKDGTCWCDDVCTDYGDCCGDLATACPAPKPEDPPVDPEPPQTKACGGFAGLPCEKGEFCKFAIEDICGNADAMGECKQMPQVCTEIWAPVCGCDGKTYGNECEASGAGVSVVSKGECAPAKCNIDNDCQSDEYCNFAAEDNCGKDKQNGSCEKMPEVCPLILLPVCGCDNQTYSSPCQAHAGGASIAHPGKCEEPVVKKCGGKKGMKCGEGEYCDFDDNAFCGFGDQTGVCKSTPEICIKIFAPVCGCDGKEYGNSCQAHANGTSILSKGKCKP